MLSQADKRKLVQHGKSLRQLIAACPELWQETGSAINERLGGLRGRGAQAGDSLGAYVKELAAKAEAWRAPLEKSGWNLGMVERAFPDLMRARLAKLALQNYLLGAVAGRGGKIRFNSWNGLLLQGLFFRAGFERKPVSPLRHALTWPIVGQKNILMRLVYKKGIYCFYAAPLLRGLVGLLAGRGPVLELAAGDGTLARFLRARGLEVAACDDYSWEATAAAARPDVERLDAREALRRHKPRAVVCSWPPAGNDFERAVFEAPQTELYVVIGSRHQFASGDRAAYARAVGDAERPGPFAVENAARLARWVLPRELDNEILIFRRR